MSDSGNERIVHLPLIPEYPGEYLIIRSDEFLFLDEDGQWYFGHDVPSLRSADTLLKPAEIPDLGDLQFIRHLRPDEHGFAFIGEEKQTMSEKNPLYNDELTFLKGEPHPGVARDADGNPVLVITESKGVRKGDEVWLKDCRQPFISWASGNQNCVYVTLPFWDGADGNDVFISSRHFSFAVRRLKAPVGQTGLFLTSNDELILITAWYDGDPIVQLHYSPSDDRLLSVGRGRISIQDLYELLPLRRVSIRNGRLVNDEQK